MSIGNLNSEISERPSKATENHISQNAQKNKELQVKTTFALSPSSDNGKLPKTGDKKNFKFLSQNGSRIRSGKSQDPFTSGKNIARNVGRKPAPAQPISAGRHVIKPGTTSTPVVTGIATMTRSSSVTQNKVPPIKRTIKSAALNKVSNGSKKNYSLPKPEFTPTDNFKTVEDSNSLTSLKESTTCPPCLKLEQYVNCSRAKTPPGWDLPQSFLPRPATSEIKDFSTVNIHSKPGPDEKISATELTKKKGIRLFKKGVKNHVLHVRAANFVVTGGEMKDHNRKPDSDVNQPPGRDNSDPNRNIPGLSSPRPIEYYDSFDSIERKNHVDEISSPDEKTSKDLEWEIFDTREKTDFLSGSEDFSDIIRQLHSLYDEQGSDADGSTSDDKTNAPSTRKVGSPDLNADEKLPQKGADKENKEFHPQKNILFPAPQKPEPGKRPVNTHSKREKTRGADQPQKNILLPPPQNPEPGKRPVNTHSKREKSSTADQPVQEHGNRSPEKGPVRDSEAEVPCIPSEFFQTHKNLGFIGKEVDEEHVSFDPALVTLYQPRETQMLFYDLANCVATQAYLKMCGINYVLVERKNAEHMSPSGKIPFVSSCLCIIPEFEGIVSFMQYKKYSCVRVRECDKAAFRATVSMIVDTLEVAERYICWYDEETVIKYTKPMIGGLFPFPLNHVIYWKKKYEERKRLALEETKEKSFDAVLRQINYCFSTLSQILGDNSFFFGDACSEIDALVYGHIYAAFTTKEEGLFRDLQFIIRQFPNLIMFAINVDKMFLLNKFPPLHLPPLG